MIFVIQPPANSVRKVEINNSNVGLIVLVLGYLKVVSININQSSKYICVNIILKEKKGKFIINF